MTEHKQPLKLIMSYDLTADNVQEYYQFVMGRYIPSMKQLGFELAEAWTYAYSSDPDLPNRTVTFVTPDASNMDTLLDGDAWPSLNDELAQFITNFDYKFVPYRTGFQI